MNTKNYFVRENATEQQFFCQLQVSNKFRNTMDAQEAQLVEYIAARLVHRSATAERVQELYEDVLHEVVVINDQRRDDEPFLLITYSPLRKLENGFIRIERSSGRHQSLLLPIIDFRGEVV